MAPAGEAPVVAVHCKAGKGRTGVMLAAYLVWSRHEGCEDAGAALSFFRRVRTSDGDAVVNPSQVRYVHHFASLAATPEVERPRLLQGAPVTLLAVGLSRAPAVRVSGASASAAAAAAATPGQVSVVSVTSALGSALSSWGSAAGSSWLLQLSASAVEARELTSGTSPPISPNLAQSP